MHLKCQSFKAKSRTTTKTAAPRNGIVTRFPPGAHACTPYARTSGHCLDLSCICTAYGVTSMGEWMSHACQALAVWREGGGDQRMTRNGRQNRTSSLNPRSLKIALLDKPSTFVLENCGLVWRRRELGILFRVGARSICVRERGEKSSQYHQCSEFSQLL